MTLFSATPPSMKRRKSNRKRCASRFGILAAATAGALLAGPSQATDGVLELNQTCAVQTGCMAGDSPGFPISMIGGQAGRNYRLTSDLEIPDADTIGVLVSSGLSGVTIDLNGFSIRGITECTSSGGFLICSPFGSGAGIFVAANSDHVRILNGHIVGAGNIGIFGGDNAFIDSVTVSESGSLGISLGERGFVQKSTATRNGADGFLLGSGSFARDNNSTHNSGNGFSIRTGARVQSSTAMYNVGSGISSENRSGVNLSGNTLYSNALHGIDVGSSSTIKDNTIGFSGLTGISTSDGSIIESNTVSSSEEHGIIAGVGSAIRGNAVLANGSNPTHHGIRCSLGCRADNNTVRSNAGFGLRFNSSSSGYGDNTIGANAAGTVSFGRDRGGNVCETSTTCP